MDMNGLSLKETLFVGITAARSNCRSSFIVFEVHKGAVSLVLPMLRSVEMSQRKALDA